MIATKKTFKKNYKLHFWLQVVSLLIVTAVNSNETLDATFNDWMKVCNSQSGNCVGVSFAQDVVGKRVARFVLNLGQSKGTEIKASGTLLIPYESAIPHLPSGIIIKIDNHKEIKERFHFCDKNGCNVKYSFTESGLKLIESSSNILVKYKDIRDLKIIKTMDISLNGVSELLLSIKE